MRALIVIIILFPYLAQTQVYPFNAKTLLWNISPRIYKSDPAITQVCPWQEWRLLDFQHFQIDLLLTEEEAKVIEYDHTHLIRDMRMIYEGAGYDELTIVAMDYRYRIHTAGMPKDIWRYGERDNHGWALDPTRPNPEFGWERKVMADGETVMAAKDIAPGLVQLSIVWFIDFY